VIGSQTLGTDERFSTVVGRLRHHEEIDGHIRAWTRELPQEAVQMQLATAGVPAERVRNAEAVVNSEDSGHVFKWVDVPGLQKQDLAAGLPFAFSRSQTFEPESPPVIGAHTRTALREWIGLSEAEIEELDAAGALT
jgi:formyl-CoA transferase/CoA:oxalate CoA-transferase